MADGLRFCGGNAMIDDIASGMGPSIYLADPEANVIELKGPARRD